MPDPGPHQVLVPLPEFGVEELAPVAELLWQEGFRVWMLSPEQMAELRALRRLFGRRARIGVHQVVNPEQARTAAKAGASFISSPFLAPELVQAVPQLPVVLGGMTLSELQSGLDAGAAAVQLYPSEAFGTALARTLPPLLPDWSLIAAGKMEYYQADLWLGAGAFAVCPDDLVAPDLVLAESLTTLRRQVQRWQVDAGGEPD